MAFPHEHPTYILRRLEAQNTKLRKLARDLETADVSDPETLKAALKAVSIGMADIALATGSLAQWVNQKIR